MTEFLRILIFCIWVVGFALLIYAGQFLRQTNALAARRWAIASSLFLGILYLFTESPLSSFVPSNSLMRNASQWYIAAILLLTPFVSILGARRPTNKFWSYFIVLPMIFVLGFPILVNWMGGGMDDQFSIQPPVLIGFLFVLMMGVGNYFGTQLTLPAILAGCSVILIVVPLTTTVSPVVPVLVLAMTFPAAVAMHGLSIIWAYWSLRKRSNTETGSPYNQLWFNFQNLFGIVWAKRVAEQINQAAESKQWQVRLELHGLVWQQTELTTEQKTETIKELDKHLRWALLRFVEEEWIERSLK
ncbi:hypothetical protein MNBD_PLANCTO02-2896 [hydrothermal vent metagenome]|uniref:Uncharacterized protein n=1 Tax=hydrothermal vent metagenome TaxID=652676 RepID=A0A3B1E0L1_9ZZZZ